MSCRLWLQIVAGVFFALALDSVVCMMYLLFDPIVDFYFHVVHSQWLAALSPC